MRSATITAILSLMLIFSFPVKVYCNNTGDSPAGQSTSTDDNTEDKPEHVDGVKITTLEYIGKDGAKVLCYIPYFDKPNIDATLLETAIDLVRTDFKIGTRKDYSFGRQGGSLTYFLDFINKHIVRVTVQSTAYTLSREYDFTDLYFDLETDKKLKIVDFFAGGEKGLVEDMLLINQKWYEKTDTPDFKFCKKHLKKFIEQRLYRLELSSKGVIISEPMSRIEGTLQIGERRCPIGMFNTEAVPWSEWKNARPRKKYIEAE